MSSDEEHQVPLPEDVASGDDADTECETEMSSDEEDWEWDDDDYVPIVRVPLYQRAAGRLLEDERNRAGPANAPAAGRLLEDERNRAGPGNAPVQVSNSPQEAQDPGIELAAEVEASENVLNDAFLADS